MKKILLIGTLVTNGCIGFGQHDDLPAYERRRIDITKKGMLVLGAWSAAHMVMGAIGTNTRNPEVRYFHQMNVTWNSANLLIAGLGYLGAVKEKTGSPTLSGVLLHQHKVEKTFLFNAGLDLAYVTAGLYLAERSKRNADPSRLKGYGNSVMLQGGFLFLFDAVMYKLHGRHGKRLTVFTDQLVVVSPPGGFALSFRL